MEISQEAKDRILLIVRKAYAQLALEREQAVAKYEAEQAILVATPVTPQKKAANLAAIRSLFKRINNA